MKHVHDLEARNAELELLNQDLNKTDRYLRSLNECFLKFEKDPLVNINLLVATFGDLVEASFALYNRFQGDIHSAPGQWNTPAGFKPTRKLEGTLCYLAFLSDNKKPVLFRDLQNTNYSKTDPMVGRYGLKTFFGKAVNLNGLNLGSLCVCFQNDYSPGENENRLMDMVASAIGIEECRLQADEALTRQNEALSKLNKFSFELSMLTPAENPEEFFVKRIREISGAKGVVFSKYDPESKKTTVQQIDIESGLLKKVLRLLGTPMKDIHSTVTDKIYQEITNEIIGVRKTLFDASFGSVSRPVSTAIQTLLNVDRFIGIAYLVEGELYGTSLLAMSKGQPDPPRQLLEYFVFLAAASLRRKKAEAKIVSDEKKYRLLAEISSDVTWHLDANFCFDNISPSCETILGYKPEEIIGKSIWSTLKPEYIDYVREVSAKRLADEKKGIRTGTNTFELQQIRKDGSSIWTNVVVTAHHDESGALIGLYGIIHDVTKQKQLENLNAQTQQNYEAFFNTIDDFLFVLDQQGNIIHTNSTVTRRLGYTSEELTGISVLMVHPPDRREEAGRIVGEMLQGSSAYCPVPIITKSGVQIPVETRVSHGFWNGKPVIFGVTKDISKLMLSEEKFSILFRVNPSACGLSDIDNHKYIEVNESFYNLFGFDKTEVIGKTAYELGLFNHEAAKSILLKADSNGSITDAEVDLKSKNGEIKHVLLSSENIYVQDKKFRYTVVNDITERKKAEFEIQQKNKELLKLNADKDRFISILGHDLKSPFNGLLGMSELLIENIRKYDIDKIEKFANFINQSAKNTYNLLDDILVWTQSQSGKIPFEPAKLNLTEICKGIISDMKQLSDTKKISIIHTTVTDSIVFADRDMLKTVLRNLISNAIKFTMPGGTIVMKFEQSQTGTTVFISDNGIGISPILMNRLFDISQINTTKGTANESGTGLGLLLCKDFIEKHDGKIWVESEMGKGSTFIFTLPAER